MSHAITLNVPENFMLPLQRLAHAAQKPVEEVVLTALRASLPPLEGLPPDMMENLTALETLNEAALRKVVYEKVPAATARALHQLLVRQSEEGLNEKEQARIAALQHEADLVMLRKACAAVLLQQFSVWNKSNCYKGLDVFDKGFEGCSQVCQSLKSLIFCPNITDTQV